MEHFTRFGSVIKVKISGNCSREEDDLTAKELLEVNQRISRMDIRSTIGRRALVCCQKSKKNHVERTLENLSLEKAWLKRHV